MGGRRPASRGLIIVLVLGVFVQAAFGQQALPLRVVSLTSPVKHGRAASIQIKTVPGAACAIMVIYKSGPSRAKGLGPKVSDREGLVAWTWIVGTRTTPGSWPVKVECSAGNRHGGTETHLVVE